jgi:hypothetical protein
MGLATQLARLQQQPVEKIAQGKKRFSILRRSLNKLPKQGQPGDDSNRYGLLMSADRKHHSNQLILV